MKMTKRIATMVACAVMAASSMVGMSASAGFSSTMLEPNGSYESFTVGGVNYGFQIRSEVETTTSGGKTQANSKTYLHEVVQRKVPTGNVKVQTQLYGKSKRTGKYTLLSVGYTTIDSNATRIYATTSWVDQYDEVSSYYTTGLAEKRLSSYYSWINLLSVNTSSIS